MVNLNTGSINVRGLFVFFVCFLSICTWPNIKGLGTVKLSILRLPRPEPVSLQGLSFVKLEKNGYRKLSLTNYVKKRMCAFSRDKLVARWWLHLEVSL